MKSRLASLLGAAAICLLQMAIMTPTSRAQKQNPPGKFCVISPAPCVDQPAAAGSVSISGESKNPGGVKVTVRENHQRVTPDPKCWESGKNHFLCNFRQPLGGYAEVDVTFPKADGGGAFLIERSFPDYACNAAPCLTQPKESDSKVLLKLVAAGGPFYLVVNPLSPNPASGEVKPGCLTKIGDACLLIPAGAGEIKVDGLKAGYTVELYDANAKQYVPPLVPVMPSSGLPGAAPRPAAGAAANKSSSCTAKLEPCLNQATATTSSSATPSISGFVAPTSKAEVDIDNVPVPTSPNIRPDGSFTLPVASLKAGASVKLYEIPTPNLPAPPAPPVAPPPAPPAGPGAAVDAPKTYGMTVKAAPATGTGSSLYTLGLAGINATSSSSSGPTQQYFASFDLIAPLEFLGPGACKSGDLPAHPLDDKCRIWINPRIASAPAPASTALTSFSSAASLASGINGQTVGQITQTFEFQAGFEYDLVDPYWGQQFGFKTSWARISPALILGGGVVTPLSSTTNASEFELNTNLGAQFNNNPVFAQQYPLLAAALCNSTYGYAPGGGCPAAGTIYKHVAFILPNRSRFYRDYFGGLRLRTYFFSGSSCAKDYDERVSEGTTTSDCHVENTYPGTIDIRVGQDETVTAGKMVGPVITIGANYPLPGTSGAIHIFASTYLGLHSNRNATPLALLTTAPAVAITDPTVIDQPIQPSDHDYYRLGLGIDLIAAISKWVAKSNSSSGAGSN